MALFVLSLCPFDISVGVGVFVMGLSQISSFFSRIRGRRFESRRRQILFFLFIEKFTEYLQTFIYILARLSLCVILSSQVNACISEFDLLLSTYSK